MGSLSVVETPLAGLLEIQALSNSDQRGSFRRLFCVDDLALIRPRLEFSQINLSETSHRGTVRGMHFQRSPAAEAKLISCVRGTVFDVAIDLRANSPTFLQWHGVELSDRNMCSVFVPEGFAHGFQALSDNACLVYMHTHSWTPECEGGVRYDDPAFGIRWPMLPQHLSEKDEGHQMIGQDFTGLEQ